MYTWSFSGLKKFVTCPKQYHEVKVLQNFVEPDTDATRYGKDVHNSLECYVRDSTPLPENYKRFQKAADALIAIPGVKYPEHKMALTDTLEPALFDEGYWVRGIADLLIVDNDYGFIVDYKTGSDRYADLKQLRLMAYMAFVHFPKLQTIKSGLMFLMNGNFMPEEYTRSLMPSLWRNFIPDLNRLTLAYETDKWSANPSGLCRKHCVVTSCMHNGTRR